MKDAIFQLGFRLTKLLGFDPRAPFGIVRNTVPFLADLYSFRSLARSAKTRMSFGVPYPILQKREASGTASGHYFHQDLLVARRIFSRNPRVHVDVGSRIDGFVAHVASFRAIEVFDVRPLEAAIPNVTFRQADLMNLPDQFEEFSPSVSCLHALEHFGLGRYGDPIDPDGHLRGLESLTRLVTKKGMLYLSVPIGPQRIEFNAHRVFSVDYLLGLLKPRFDLVDFSYVDDAGALHESVPVTESGSATNFGCRYGCGIFELMRR